MRVLLIDGSEIFRMGLRAAISGADDLEIVAEAATARAAEAAARTHTPDVVVADLDLFDRDAYVLAGALRAAAPGARILALASAEAESAGRDAVLAGAGGAASKNDAAADIVGAIRDVGHGRATRTLRATTEAKPGRIDVARGAPSAALARLSAREREIFDLIIWGQTNKQVALRLGISVKTVETHRSHINGKLQVHSAAELVRLASLCGVLEAGRAPETLAPAPGPRLVAETG